MSVNETTTRHHNHNVELLAPAGDWDCLRAAVANGADAVFFGVEKFNARARAKNFVMDELPEIMAYLHMYGVKGFLTFNILVFEVELREAQHLIEACIRAGVDAVIVQDLGLVKLIRQLSPDFPIHGSTQMTITSPEAVEFTKPFGLERVVLGRENSLKHIQMIGKQAKLPMEVFVHGALCVSYSGQCLTSEMWGGRSANRGECAQACRLPYDLMVDGVQKPMGDVAYLLSPKDLAALELVPELIEAGVTSFKIEGRLKNPEYVANVVSKYRKAIDRHFAGQDAKPSHEDVRELQQSFSRGFTVGFLRGTNNKQLVDGTYPKKRGVYLGTVAKVLRDAIVCQLQEPLKRGDGIVFDAGDPTKQEEGGRVYDLRRDGVKIEGVVGPGGPYEMVLGRNDVDLRRVRIGHKIWKTSDPHLERELRKTFSGNDPYRTFAVNIRAEGTAGERLRTWWTDIESGAVAFVESTADLQQALKRPLTEELLGEQWGRLGGTLFELQSVRLECVGEVIVPMSELNQIRRQAVDLLVEARRTPPKYVLNEWNERDFAKHRSVEQQPSAVRGHHPELTVLCRQIEQVQAVAARTDVQWIYADFEFVKQYPAAVSVVREWGKKIALATPRIHMPGENGLLKRLLDLQPDALLVRNTGALYYYLREFADQPVSSRPLLIGDFSLNIANHNSVELFRDAGCDVLTPSYDLNIQQMLDLLRASDTSLLEVVVHQHMPMFHTEHCVYCTFLSEGTDYTNCGRPCEQHQVSLQDRVGMSHPVRVDEGCRNTVYNAVEQSGAEYLQTFCDLGVASLRIEFLEETADKVCDVIALYQKALAGQMSGSQVWRTLKATNQLGVTRGQLVK
jgi:putative protease